MHPVDSPGNPGLARPPIQDLALACCGCARRPLARGADRTDRCERTVPTHTRSRDRFPRRVENSDECSRDGVLTAPSPADDRNAAHAIASSAGRRMSPAGDALIAEYWLRGRPIRNTDEYARTTVCICIRPILHAVASAPHSAKQRAPNETRIARTAGTIRRTSVASPLLKQPTAGSATRRRKPRDRYRVDPIDRGRPDGAMAGRCALSRALFVIGIENADECF
jgi:hypothetical protein